MGLPIGWAKSPPSSSLLPPPLFSQCESHGRLSALAVRKTSLACGGTGGSGSRMFLMLAFPNPKMKGGVQLCFLLSLAHVEGPFVLFLSFPLIADITRRLLCPKTLMFFQTWVWSDWGRWLWALTGSDRGTGSWSPLSARPCSEGQQDVHTLTPWYHLEEEVVHVLLVHLSQLHGVDLLLLLLDLRHPGSEESGAGVSKVQLTSCYCKCW